MSSETRVTGPRLELVVAAARNGVIGRENGLPWSLPGDLAYFKRLTMGQPILMGRRTWDSIGRPLPGRLNLVLSRDRALRLEGATVVHTLRDAILVAGAAPRLMVIGGAELFRMTLSDAKVLHLTEVDADVEGDVRFPDWSPEEWREVQREAHPADARHAYAYAFVTLERAPG